MEIWIHINDKQEGPFAIEEIEVGRIAPDTPVWHEGLPDWTYAKDVPALAHLFVVETPEQSEQVDEPEQSDLPEPPELSEQSELSDSPAVEAPQQPWQPQPPRQQPQQQYHYQQPQSPYRQQGPRPQPWRPAYSPYPYRAPGRPGPMRRPFPQRPMPAAQYPAEPDFKPKAPSMWLWLSIPVTILFGFSMFGIAAIILGIISRKKYNSGSYRAAYKLSYACEWLIMLGISLGFAIIPFSMFV